MRTAALVAFLALLTAGAAADDLTDSVELGWTVGFSDGPGYVAPAFQTGASLNAGTSQFRLRGNIAWAKVHKGETPGGYSIGGGGGAEVDAWKLHALGGFNMHFTDQQVWTKRVHYAYGGLGYRWSDRPAGRREVVNLEVVISREMFSTYANNVTGLQANLTYDRRLRTSPWHVRLGISVGGMWFKSDPYPGARHLQGTTFSTGIGLAYRLRR